MPEGAVLPPPEVVKAPPPPQQPGVASVNGDTPRRSFFGIFGKKTPQAPERAMPPDPLNTIPPLPAEDVNAKNPDTIAGKFSTISKTFPAMDSGWVKGTETPVGISAPAVPAPEVSSSEAAVDAPLHPQPEPIIPERVPAGESRVIPPIEAENVNAAPPQERPAVLPGRPESGRSAEFGIGKPLEHRNMQKHLRYPKPGGDADILNKGFSIEDIENGIKPVAMEYFLHTGTQQEGGFPEVKGRTAFHITDQATNRIAAVVDNREIDLAGGKELTVLEQRGDRLYIRTGDGEEYSYDKSFFDNATLQIPLNDQVSLAIEGFDPETQGIVVAKLPNQESTPILRTPDVFPQIAPNFWQRELNRLKRLITIIPLVATGAPGVPPTQEMPPTPPAISEPVRMPEAPFEIAVQPPSAEPAPAVQPPTEVKKEETYTEYKWNHGDVKSVDGFIDAQIALAVTPKSELGEKFKLTNQEITDMEQNKDVYINLADPEVNDNVAGVVHQLKEKMILGKDGPEFNKLNEQYNLVREDLSKKITELNGEGIYDPSDRGEFATTADPTAQTVVKFLPTNEVRAMWESRRVQ